MLGRFPTLVALLLVVASVGAGASTPRDRYERVLAQEQTLRLDGPRPSPLSQIRRTVTDYEALARRYPTSGYADNALFQAAGLARAAHRVYGSDIDRDHGIRLLRWLVRAYPSSSLRTRAERLLATSTPRPSARSVVASNARPSPAPPASRSETPPAATGRPASTMVAALPASTPASDRTSKSLPGLALLRDVRREIHGGAVRVTLVFDGEIAYQQEELTNPSRLYFDLERTSTSTVLQDAALTFDGPTARHIRVGRPRPDTTRVVIDLKGTERYSVFTLYNPYRLSIDLVPEPPPLLRARALTPDVRVPSAEPRPVAALTRVAPERLAPRPLPHPLADRPLVAAAAPRPRVVTAALVPPPLVARTTLPRAVPAAGRVSGRAVSAPIQRFLAEQRARKDRTPLASKDTAAPASAAPSTPAPNSLGGFSIARQLGLTVSRIVIDPGHGGHDPGAMAQRTSEAEIVLDVALRLEKLLAKEPGVEVVLTRRTDTFIPLEERTAIANRASADLFLSIHVNSSRNTRASGAETYFLNFASNPEAEAVAARENATASKSMHQLPDIVRAISLNNKLDESRDFARAVQDSLMRGVTRNTEEITDRGVKQAPFVVLIGAGMPSVLAEIGFLTNQAEGVRLRTGAFRQQIAQALFEAVGKYQRSLKTVGTIASQ